MKNINLSYSNSPICEYIGSKIYGLIGLPVYKARICIFELQGRRVNPYHIMESMKYQECSDAIRRLAPRIGGCMNGIRVMIKEIPILSEVQKQFFTLIIEYRYEKVFLPVYQKIMQREFEDCEQKKGKRR